jgi:tetratricopeptide (TPR) repeat protein
MIALLLALLLPPADDPLERALRAYREGQYAEAHELWLEALDDAALAKGPLLFNLGSCAYRMGQVPEAVLWWERARLRAPRDGEVAFNLRRAEQELGLAPPDRGWRAWLTSRELLMLVVAAQSIGLLGVVLLRHRGARLALAVGVIATLPAVVTLLDGGSVAEAVVLAPGAVLRPEPHQEIPSATTVTAGSLARIVAMSDRWALVECAAGRGWVERPVLGLVE